MTDPIYWTIAQDLREQIETGGLVPGAQLPSELELRDTYRASRNTIRDAVKWLTTRGLVETRPGQGTFVAQPSKPFVATLSADPATGLGGGEGDGAFAEVRERGLNPSASVPRVEVRTAPRYIAERLRVAEGTHVITRRQELYIDRTPWSLQTTAYQMDLVQAGATDLLMAHDIPGGAVAYLKRTLGIARVGHRDRILVRAPGDDEVRFFKLPDNGRVSVFSVIRTRYRESAEGPVPFCVTFTVLPADRNQFVVNTGDCPAGLAKAASDRHYTAPADTADRAD